MSLMLDLLFPPKCVLCGEILPKGRRDLCTECEISVPAYGNHKKRVQFLDSFAAVWYYEESVRESLLRYKFGGKRSYGASYGRLLAAVVAQEHPEGFDLLTWVPISRRRKLVRGFDQGELIAKALGKCLGMEPKPLLQKVRHNCPQSGITGFAERKANVLGVYRVKHPEALRGKRILLLDDILTTGSTAGECARMLKMAGAKEVHCAAVAARK